MARFITLYSGSSGNCAVVEDGGQFLAVDMGGSCKQTLGALVAAGLSPKNLEGILVTHEHSDHIKGLAVFLKQVQVPLYATAPTLEALRAQALVPPGARMVAVDEAEVKIGGFLARNFHTGHDAAQSCGWQVQALGGGRMALATDLGQMTPEIYACLENAALVALEANYDPVLLQLGPYPAHLKKRIVSARGHLSNTDAAQTVARLFAGGCRQIVLCHLSAENNRPRLVAEAVDEAFLQHGLRLAPGSAVQIAKRHEPGSWVAF